MIDRSKLDRMAAVIVAVCLMMFGGSVFFDPVFMVRNYGVRLNFGAYHQLIGVAILVIGVLLLWYAIVKWKKTDN